MRPLNPVDPRLYFVCGPENANGHPLPDLFRAAAEGGITLAQLRAKHATTREFIELARAIHDALKGTGVPLVINDRVDVAMASGVEGVHIGQEDMEAADARRILGDTAIIGITVKNRAEIKAAPPELVDYHSIGGIHPTPTKNNPNAPLGLDGLSELCRFLDGKWPGMPRCAISGIDAQTAGPILKAGAKGIAVVRAIAAADDPRAAAAFLRNLIEEALGHEVSA